MALEDPRDSGTRGQRSDSNRGGGGGGRDRAGNRGFGGTRKVGNATVADHMVATGDVRTPSIGRGGVAQGNYSSQDDAYNDYARAVGDPNALGTPSLATAMENLLTYSSKGGTPKTTKVPIQQQTAIPSPFTAQSSGVVG